MHILMKRSSSGSKEMAVCRFIWGPIPFISSILLDNSVAPIATGHSTGTQGTTLAELNRDRSNDQKVVLHRRDLDETELKQFLNEMTQNLHELQQHLSARTYQNVTNGSRRG